MSRYIDADKLCEYYADRHKGLCQNYGETDQYCKGYEDAWLIAENHFTASADVVEVVRCGECRHCKYNSSADKYKCDRRGYYSEEVKITDYCSYGERREG